MLYDFSGIILKWDVYYLVLFITIRNLGGGHKRLYRKLDFKRNKFGIKATVFTIEYDPNRSARISLLHYLDGEKRYVLHCNGLTVGDNLVSDFEALVKLGNALPLSNIPLGTLIHNVEFQVWVVFFASYF